MFNPVADSLAKIMEGPQRELQQTLRAILAEQSKAVALLEAIDATMKQVALAPTDEPEPTPPPQNLRVIKTPKTKEKP
jgi:hypothetical protein